MGCYKWWRIEDISTQTYCEKCWFLNRWKLLADRKSREESKNIRSWKARKWFVYLLVHTMTHDDLSGRITIKQKCIDYIKKNKKKTYNVVLFSLIYIFKMVMVITNYWLLMGISYWDSVSQKRMMTPVYDLTALGPDSCPGHNCWTIWDMFMKTWQMNPSYQDKYTSFLQMTQVNICFTLVTEFPLMNLLRTAASTCDLDKFAALIACHNVWFTSYFFRVLKPVNALFFLFVAYFIYCNLNRKIANTHQKWHDNKV